MGLLYTTSYVDFDQSDWQQIRVDPPIFETKTDSVSLEIFDVTQKSYKLTFRKGAQVRSFRVVGKFRITWDDSYLLAKS